MDIMLDLARLRETLEGLDASIGEFEAASSINDDLEEAVGSPDGRGALRSKVGDFESAWGRKRAALTENLTGVRDQLQAIIDGWSEWDTGAAAEMSAGSVTAQPSSIPTVR